MRFYQEEWILFGNKNVVYSYFSKEPVKYIEICSIRERSFKNIGNWMKKGTLDLTE